MILTPRLSAPARTSLYAYDTNNRQVLSGYSYLRGFRSRDG